MIICSYGKSTFASIEEHPNIHPTGQAGLIDNYSANTLGFSRLLFSVSGNFAYDADLVSWMRIREGRGFDTLHPFAVLYGIHPAIAFGITDFLDIALSQPFFVDILEGNQPSGGAGDFELSLKCRIPGNKVRIMEGALCSKFTFPNGEKMEGFSVRHGYYIKNVPELDMKNEIEPAAFLSAGKPTWSLSALGTLGKGVFYLHVNLGACFTFDKRLDNAMLGGMGVEFRPVEGIGLFTEVFAEPRWKNLTGNFSLNKDPLRISPSITFHAPNGMNLSAGGSYSFASRKEFFYNDRHRDISFVTRIEPQWRVWMQLGWNGFIIDRDRDNDMILDRDDECPDVAEDVDGFADHDGCPDPDNDNDGIQDVRDSCKNIPEDIDGFEDEDGCPDPDNDRDGIPDSLDVCPNEPEDRDGFEESNGCPDYDNDNDGIPDVIDKCIGIPEDRDGFEDDDGCPDYDNDLDGITDSVDACPDIAGVFEQRGCPKPREKAKEIPRGRVILANVRFEGGSDELTPESSADLDRLFESLTDYPEVLIEIQAHTDNSLPPAASLTLSQKRAAAVRDYLIRKGVDPSRITAAGKGSAEPIADNKTIHGRRLNNRIEIHRKD